MKSVGSRVGVFWWCCVAGLFAQGLGDGSFEASAPGGPPGAPWVVTGGGGIVRVETAPDDLFPSDGARYLRIDAGTTGPAVAGPGPHAGATVAQVSQSFVRPPGSRLSIAFDWDFLQSQATPNSNRNDFFSVDVLNAQGALVVNVLLLDSGQLAVQNPLFTYPNVPVCASPFGTTSGLAWVPAQSTIAPNAESVAPAGFKRAWADLSSLTPGQTYTLQFSVGNGGNATNPSLAYVDDVALSVADVNTPDARLRVLPSSHRSGAGATNGDFSRDERPETPHLFRCGPGSRLAVRAGSVNSGTAWALFLGQLLPVGNDYGPFGISNIDLFQPFSALIDGFGGSDLLSLVFGTIPAQGPLFFEGTVPASTPPGTRFVVQGFFADPTGPAPFLHSAATEIRVVGLQIPQGSLLVPGAANSASDGMSVVSLAGFGSGSFAFYGNSYSQVRIAANGYIAFADNVAVDDGDPSEYHFSTGDPRIAVLWSQLDPSQSAAGGVFYASTADTFTVEWRDVPGDNGNGSNTFGVQLYTDGSFTLFFGPTSLTDGLCGISPGGLADPGSVPQSANLSTDIGFCQTVNPGIFGSPTAVWQVFGTYLQGQFNIDSGLRLDSYDLGNLGGPGPARLNFIAGDGTNVLYEWHAKTR